MFRHASEAAPGQRHNGGKMSTITTYTKTYLGGASNVGYYDGHVDKIDKPDIALTNAMIKEGCK
jgi:prepilin-type processing-associated H-X9-DG protein